MNRGRCQDCRDADEGRGSHCGQCECCNVPSLTEIPKGTTVSIHYVRDDHFGSGDLTGEYLGWNFRTEDVEIRTPRGFRNIIPLRWITEWAVA